MARRQHETDNIGQEGDEVLTDQNKY